MTKNRIFPPQKAIASIAILLIIATTTSAQESIYRYADAIQLWRLTDNAAGLSLDSLQNRGYAEFRFEHREGDYHRVQEGGEHNQLQFFTERYQAIGKYLVGYGRFRFDMSRTQDRAWCDVRQPYGNNPFYPGSSIKGKYDTQDFDMTAAVGTVGFGGFRFGTRLDYQVGDLSRLRDPRSRSQLLDYRITPSATYTIGSHALGLALSYRRRKEKIPNVTTVQTDPNLKYYRMTGLEQATGILGGYSGFNREWVDHRLGGELTYEYRADYLRSLLALKLEKGTENVYEQYKGEPGKSADYRYALALRNRLRQGSLIHEADITIDYDEAFADEYRQQLEQTKDAQTGYTSYSYSTQIVFKKRYQSRQFDASLHYRIHFTHNNEEQGYAGLKADLSRTRKKHLLPESCLNYGGTSLMGEGGLAIGKYLWVDATAGRFFAADNELSLADATTEVAQQVLLPDTEYYRASYWRGNAAIKLQFPLNIKGQHTLWYIRAYADYLHTDNSLSRTTIGIGIGLFN